MGRVRPSVGILIILIGVAVLAAFFVYAGGRAAPASPFVSQRENLGRKLYERVSALPAGEYPETPAAVMEAYSDILLLLYGDFITDDALRAEIIAVQRGFWTEDMLAAATLDEQLAGFSRELEIINGQDVRLTAMDVKNAALDTFDKTLAIVATSEAWLHYKTTRHNFYLRLTGADDEGSGGRWLIQSLETVE